MQSSTVNSKDYYYQKGNMIGYIFIISYLFLTISSLIIVVESNLLLVRIIGIVLLGFLQAGFNQGKHEFLHNTAINNKYINTISWYIFSIPILVNPHLNKNFHLGHHKYAGTDKDPELSFDVRKQYQIHEVLLRKLVNPFTIGLLVTNIRILFNTGYPSYVEDKNGVRRDAYLLILFHLFFVFSSIYLIGWEYAFWWYMTLEFVGFNILCVYDIAEHRGCNVSVPPESSRTCISNPFIWYMTWFNNFHSVHHLDEPGKGVTFYKRKDYFFDKSIDKSKFIEKGYISLLVNMYKDPTKYI